MATQRAEITMIPEDTKDRKARHFADSARALFTAGMLAHPRHAALFAGTLPDFTPAGTVLFRDLVFRYADHLPAIIQGLTLEIPSGKLAALVGPRGCGKSTLIQLLQGLHKPAHGNVMTCGRVTATGSHLPAKVGVVAREPMLFGGSVIGNLMMANPAASFGNIVRACQMAQVHESIMALPAAYDTEIGEGGVKLKPGQRQCISLARALLRDPDILALDDSFDLLDDEWSANLARALNRLKGRVTVLLAARELPAGLNLDMVFSMRQPRLLRFSVIEGGKPPPPSQPCLRRSQEPAQ